MEWGARVPRAPAAFSVLRPRLSKRGPLGLLEGCVQRPERNIPPQPTPNSHHSTSHIQTTRATPHTTTLVSDLSSAGFQPLMEWGGRDPRAPAAFSVLRPSLPERGPLGLPETPGHRLSVVLSSSL